MAVPITLIIVGFTALMYNSGGTFDFVFGWGYYWPMAMILIGLVALLKQKRF